MSKTSTEPAITVATITAAVAAILALVGAFGHPFSDAQTAAILGVVAVIGPLVVGIITRRYVTPTATLTEPAPGAITDPPGEAPRRAE